MKQIDCCDVIIKQISCFADPYPAPGFKLVQPGNGSADIQYIMTEFIGTPVELVNSFDAVSLGLINRLLTSS